MDEKEVRVVERFHRAMARVFAGKATEAQIRRFRNEIRKEYDRVMLRHAHHESFRKLQRLGEKAFQKEMETLND